MQVVARTHYDATEETLSVPVTPEEADMLMRADGRPLKARRALPHFLYRLRVTLSNHEAEMANSRRAIESLRETRTRMGAPSTLSPLDAIRFATPEEVSQVVGHISSTQLAALQAAVNEARGLRSALAGDLAAVRNATRAILDKPGLPSEVRLDFIRLINSLPDSPPPVSTPATLEMAQAVGLIVADNTPVHAPAETSTAARELPDGDPLTGVAPAAAPAWAENHTPTAHSPLYGAAPSWVPGPGPALGT